MNDAKALILGCGYVGLVLARHLADEGVEVVATTRKHERFPEIQAAGARPAIADALQPASLKPLVDERPDVVFDLVRPQRIDDDRYTVWGTRNIVAAFRNTPPGALVYLSSTSVYGRRNGELTDEKTPANPTSPLGEARVESERLYLDLHAVTGFPARVCRVPGIYGPGRTLRHRLETGAYRRLSDEDLWSSRIHVEDLAVALAAAWRHGEPGQVYLLCDDEPVTGQEYAELTASLLSLPLPPAVDREDIRHELSTSAFERRVGSRRCDNRRMREELGVVLRYPSIREGVPAALLAEGAI